MDITPKSHDAIILVMNNGIELEIRDHTVIRNKPVGKIRITSSDRINVFDTWDKKNRPMLGMKSLTLSRKLKL